LVGEFNTMGKGVKSQLLKDVSERAAGAQTGDMNLDDLLKLGRSYGYCRKANNRILDKMEEINAARKRRSKRNTHTDRDK
jgi:hypothetical protein